MGEIYKKWPNTRKYVGFFYYRCVCAVCNERFRLTHDDGMRLEENDTRVVGDTDDTSFDIALRLPEGKLDQ